MDPAKRARLEAAGWRVGSAAEFLGLSPEETAELDRRVARPWHAPTVRTHRLGAVELTVVERVEGSSMVPPDLEGVMCLSTVLGGHVAACYTMTFPVSPTREAWLRIRRSRRHSALRDARERLASIKGPGYRHARLFGPDVYDHLACALPLYETKAVAAERVVARVVELHGLDPAFVTECLEEMIGLGNIGHEAGLVWLSTREPEAGEEGPG